MPRGLPNEPIQDTMVKMFRAMSKTLAAVAVSFLAFAPGCMKPKEAKYAELKWTDEVYYYGAKPFTGIAKETFKDGKLKALYPMKDGVLHGVVQEWWENGQMSVETHFENGKRHGLNRYWTDKGVLMKEQVYEHGESKSTIDWPNGR